MANLGAFFAKPGLLAPPEKQQKKSEIINVSESLQSATLVQVDSDLDKSHSKKHKNHSLDQDLAEVKKMEDEEKSIHAKKTALKKKLAKK
jgi:hypothetical protein